MVPSKTEPRGNDANKTAKEEVEAEMAEVRKPRAGDVDSGADRNEDQDKSVYGRRGGVIADGYNLLLLVGTRCQAGICLMGR